MRSEPPKYNLHVDLQYPVDEERGSAKFDKSKKTLVVTLPVKPGPQLIAERLGSNDSGIEVDTAYRTKQCSDEMIDYFVLDFQCTQSTCQLSRPFSRAA